MSLHVPSLRVDEVVRVIRSLDIFALTDIPDAVEALTANVGKTIPIKRLLLWIELAKQVRPPGQWAADGSCGVQCRSDLVAANGSHG